MSRYLSHRPYFSVYRYSTRLLPGGRRPPSPDYLAIACRTLKAVLKLDQSLRPFMQEQCRYVEHQAFMAECNAAIRRVYGLETCPPISAPTPPANQETV